MDDLTYLTEEYLKYCSTQKRLDNKTIKAYKIDLKQFCNFISADKVSAVKAAQIENYIADLHKLYKPKTVKRKIASVKALFHYLEYRDIIEKNPFNKMIIKFREPVILPKTIPIPVVEALLGTIYYQYRNAPTNYQRKTALRDVAVIELLFSTGIRISELCSLSPSDVNLSEKTVLIYGKGAKERKIQIGADDVVAILSEYFHAYSTEIQTGNSFFVSQTGKPLSDQTIRRMINKYTYMAAISQHITPHMFRHTFATSLLEADVDIRYIQEMLGHSSINITQIYTHVAMSKQRDILTTKHPRKNFKI